MAEQHVRFEKEGYIGIITLQRPDELNALGFATLVQLEEIIENVRIDSKETRVVLVRAEGRAFCAGADLKERKTLNQQQVRRNVRKIRDVFSAIERLPQPTIALINGFAFGGGLELALACDFRYAIREAKMGLTEVSLGIIPGAGGTQRLTRLVGLSLAKELILTARRIDAEQAYQYGMLNGVVDDLDQLQQKAMSLAIEITSNAPLAVYQAKQAIDRGHGVDIQTALDMESMCYEVIIPTKDRIEALQAFQEKRKPVFTGE
ncbi:enoyl-CoA hydratase-related protein [Brevibacillus daliensis]|uniref:enoyl-CoA hydratase-related protein n=1 Tax=Brevibacillus daliensis TaxID=2892995 RepID=UPI001E3CE5E4|nr:enoyl-CoA hydratase-related protein [Brevibacillus daliensis]